MARPISRREALLGLGAAAVGSGVDAAAVGIAVGVGAPAAAPGSGTVGGRPGAVDPHGAHQAGVRRPATPPPHALVSAYDLADPTAVHSLAEIGSAIAALAAGTHSRSSDVTPDGAGDLTITIGVGPRVVDAAAGPSAPGADRLPGFASDAELDPARSDGDLLITAYASDPSVLVGVSELVATHLDRAELRWRQRGFRAPGEGTVARNPLGFLDGISVPTTERAAEQNVWIGGGPLAGGTICVIRRIRLDVAGFEAHSIHARERIIGRRHRDGAPLSGGGMRSQPDLGAKTPEGDYLVPLHSHVRAAHPSMTGSDLMLRRGYAFDDGDGDAGLLFMCYQRTLRTFVATQQRLDEVDGLRRYMTATGSATFLILPGFPGAASRVDAPRLTPVPRSGHRRRKKLDARLGNRHESATPS